MEIYGEKVVLRPFSLEDAEGFFRYASNPNVGPIAGWKPHESVEESRKIIEDIFLKATSWTIRMKNEPEKIIGAIGLEEDRLRPDMKSREIGYSLDEAYWGRGIMTEACKLVISYAFTEMQVDILSICTSPDNGRSQGVIKKCGFHYDGRMRKIYHTYTGEDRDSLVYSLLPDEWKKML